MKIILKVLKCRSGFILGYVLVFFMLFLSWFHYQIYVKIDNYISLQYIDEIQKQLELEFKVVQNILNQDCPESTYIDGIYVQYDCYDDFVECHISSDIEYSFIYDIIKNEINKEEMK